MKIAREQIEAALEICQNALPALWEQSPSNPNRVNNARTGNLVASIWPEGCTPPHNSTHTFSRHIAQMNPEFAQALLEGWLELENALDVLLKVRIESSIAMAESALQSARAKLDEKAHD